VPKPAVLLSARFRACLRKLGRADLTRIDEALRSIPDCFGRPHAHSGVSIRRLHRNIFECRAGLKIRLLFRLDGDKLVFFYAGDHEGVRRLIREL